MPKSNLPHAFSFQDLIVYQKARQLAGKVFKVSSCFPKEENYSLTSQIRRSSRSIGAQIAEAWGKRPYERHFVSKLTDADAEQLETRHWLEVSLDCGYISDPQYDELAAGCEEIGRLLSGMISKSAQFCGDRTGQVREQPIEYFTEK
jgi:four helix bundle protein